MRKDATSATRWSYSQLKLYEGCALSWKFAYLDRLDQGPKHPSAARGIAIHRELEKFVGNPRARKVPATLTRLANRILAAKKLGARPEAEVYLDRAWRRVKKKGAWGVVKIDLHWQDGERLWVADLKTGRVRDYADQGRIYLAGLVNLFPTARTFSAEEWYTDGQVMPRRLAVFNRAQVLGIQRELALRVDRMHGDREWKARPGAACQWCPFAKSRGGPCRYG